MNNVSQLSRSGFALALVIVASVLVFLVNAHVQANANAEKIVSLAGRTWSGTDSDGDHYVFTFEHDGTLAYKSPTGSYRNGKWNQFKNAVYFEMNDHTSEYLGAITEDVMEGKAWNKQRRIWLWKVSRHE